MRTQYGFPLQTGGKEILVLRSELPPILVYDVNQDRLNDIITSIAHDYGIFWYEQGKQDGVITWTRHLIDDTWSLSHSHGLADFDGDGDLDLVTGKRFMSHNGGDPGAYEPLAYTGTNRNVVPIPCGRNISCPIMKGSVPH